MAVLKSIETPTGATGEYSKIHKVEIFAETQTVTITTNIYASAEARDSGKTIMWQDRTNIPFDAFTQDLRDVFYPVLTSYSYSFFKDGKSDEDGIKNLSVNETNQDGTENEEQGQGQTEDASSPVEQEKDEQVVISSDEVKLKDESIIDANYGSVIT